MTSVGVFILTTAITINISRAPASQHDDAYRAVMKASYIQSGVDKKVKQLEKKYVPEVVKKYGGWVTGITKALTDKRVSFEWTF